MKLSLKFGSPDDICPVCYTERLNNGDRIIMLNCKHRFHVKCITNWTNTCPVCRKILTKLEKKEKITPIYNNELKLVCLNV